jgi:exoribonuclease R
MKSTPRLTIDDLSALLRKAKKAKAKPLADRLAKLLWLRKRQVSRQELRKNGIKQG